MAGVRISGGGEFDGAELVNAATEDTLSELAKQMGVVADKATDRAKKDKDDLDKAENKAYNLLGEAGKATKATVGIATGIAASGLEAIGGASAKLVSGQYELTDMSGVLAGALRNTDTGFRTLDKVLGGTGDGLHSATKFVAESAGAFRQLSSVGAGLEGDFLELRRVAANTRMPLDEFVSLVGSNAEKLNALGGGITGGTRAFGQLSKQMYDSRMGAELQALGIGFEESNELLLDYMNTQRREIDFTKLSAQQQKAQLVTAQKYIYELDTLAKLTGKNRKEIQEEARAKAREGQNLAALRLLEMEGVQGATKNFEEMSKNIGSKMGPGFNDMFASMIRLQGAIDVNDDRQRALAAGMPEVTELMRKSALAFREGNVDAANEYRKQAESAMVSAQNDPNVLRIAAMGNVAGGVGEALSNQLEATQDFQDAVNRSAETLGVTATNAEGAAKALEGLQKAVELQQKKTQEAPVNQAVVAAETAIRDASSAMYNTIDSEFKPAIQNAGQVVADAIGGISPSDMQLFSDRLAGVAGGVQGYIEKLKEMSTNTEDFTEKERENYATIAAELEKTKKVIQDVGSTSKQVEEARLKQMNLLNTFGGEIDRYEATGGKEVNPEEKGMWDSIKDFFSSINPFNEGTLGATGELFPDFGKGTPAMLHGEEAVVTKDQMKQIILGSIKNQIESQKKESSAQSASMNTSSQMTAGVTEPEERPTATMTTPNQDDLQKGLEMLNKTMTEIADINMKQFVTLEKHLKVSKGMSGDVFKGLG